MKGKGFGGGGLQNLMRQANQMQAKMRKKQEELADAEYDGTSGGGAVSVKVNGDNKLIGLTINEDVFKEGDVEILQDMIMSAANDALQKAKDINAKEMEKITGGMNIPGF